MSELSNKISYLKGLAEGMKLSDKSDEGSLIMKLIDTLSAAADEIDKLSLYCDKLNDAADELRRENTDTNLCIDDLYDYLYSKGIMDDNEFDDDDDEIFDEYDDDDDGLFEIMCPECGEDVIVDFDMLDDDNNIVCPNCHHNIELEFDMDDHDGDID